MKKNRFNLIYLNIMPEIARTMCTNTGVLLSFMNFYYFSTKIEQRYKVRTI